MTSVFSCRVCLARWCLLTVIDSGVASLIVERFLFLPVADWYARHMTANGVGLPSGRTIYELFFVLFPWNIKFCLSHT